MGEGGIARDRWVVEDREVDPPSTSGGTGNAAWTTAGASGPVSATV